MARFASCVALLLRSVVVLAVLAALLFAARTAKADPPGPGATPIYVLQIESNGPDDQADALSNALRARVSVAHGWSLLEATQSFETLRLTKCPPPAHTPDERCLAAISAFLKGSPFVWGTLSKKGADQVSADVHLFRNGKPDGVASEAFSDNLKEHDEVLKKIAARIFAKLTGGAVTGVVSVHAGTASGAVLVDGVQKGALENGSAKIEVPTGSHVIEVRVAGFTAPTQNVAMAAGGEQDLTFTLAPAKIDAPVTVGPKSSTPWRKIVGITAIGLGVVSLAVGVAEGVNFLSLKDKLNTDRAKVPSTVTDVCQDVSTPATIDACSKYKDAKSARVLEYVFLGVGAALVGGGVILLVTDKGGERDQAVTTGARLVPRLGPTSGGLDFSYTW